MKCAKCGSGDFEVFEQAIFIHEASFYEDEEFPESVIALNDMEIISSKVFAVRCCECGHLAIDSETVEKFDKLLRETLE